MVAPPQGLQDLLGDSHRCPVGRGVNDAVGVRLIRRDAIFRLQALIMTDTLALTAATMELRFPIHEACDLLVARAELPFRINNHPGNFQGGGGGKGRDEALAVGI